MYVQNAFCVGLPVNGWSQQSECYEFYSVNAQFMILLLKPSERKSKHHTLKSPVSEAQTRWKYQSITPKIVGKIFEILTTQLPSRHSVRLFMNDWRPCNFCPSIRIFLRGICPSVYSHLRRQCRVASFLEKQRLVGHPWCDCALGEPWLVLSAASQSGRTRQLSGT